MYIHRFDGWRIRNLVVVLFEQCVEWLDDEFRSGGLAFVSEEEVLDRQPFFFFNKKKIRFNVT